MTFSFFVGISIAALSPSLRWRRKAESRICVNKGYFDSFKAFHDKLIKKYLGLPFLRKIISSRQLPVVYLEQEGPGQMLHKTQSVQGSGVNSGSALLKKRSHTHLLRPMVTPKPSSEEITSSPLSLLVMWNVLRCSCFSPIFLEPAMKLEINQPQGQVALPTAKMWVSYRRHHVRHCPKQDTWLVGSDVFPPHLFCYILFLLWSESEAGWEPGRRGHNFLVSLWPSSKSRWSRKKDIDLDPAHSPGL